MHDLHAKQETYSAQFPSAFILSFQKQLTDNEIPKRKWLGALESFLQGMALSSYCSKFLLDASRCKRQGGLQAC